MTIQRALPSRPRCRATDRARFLAAAVTCVLLGPVSLSAQVGGTEPVLEFPPPQPAWASVPGIPISWEPSACPSVLINIGPSPAVNHGGHSFSGATWTITAPGQGLSTATYAGSQNTSGGAPAGYILSDDKRYKWINPTITVECVNVQAKPSTVATESFVYAVQHYTGTDGVVQPV